MVLCAVAVTTGSPAGVVLAGAAAARPVPVASGASPTMTPRQVAKELGALRAVGERVATEVYEWGCILEAAQGPAVSTAPEGSEAATHAVATCRPVPPTDRTFPTAGPNPGPDGFRSEIEVLESFAHLAVAGRWPVGLSRSVGALGRTSAFLAAQLGTGQDDETWSAGVRASLIRLDALLGQVQARQRTAG